MEKANPAEIIETLLRHTGDARISLESKAPDRFIQLAPDAFQQIMLNIIENSRKAIDADGRIIVTLAVQADIYRITVSDDGAGMAAEVLKQVFDPFFSTRATGSGLGMAITRQLVEQMNGRITVESIENEGTTVTLAFPL